MPIVVLTICILSYRSMIKQERTWLEVLTRSGREKGMITWMSTMNTLRYIVSYFVSKECVELLSIRKEHVVIFTWSVKSVWVLFCGVLKVWNQVTNLDILIAEQISTTISETKTKIWFLLLRLVQTGFELPGVLYPNPTIHCWCIHELQILSCDFTTIL